ncbi:cinnamyl alcohol acyltransferase 1 [Tripterygium wilfordii]|uniref:Cinnamyl alcohol acyltransferase 1 n=1 Tax=Tripterygium wilfordii TaxID=458696 RepID=A0A7J7BY92_TRIWF|nr:coniferyl alcohol acyltransferase-like [Tripterygium wilfordii]KAF5726841.1 cinnamyl alcohol acyltransferase 1 [Tripterygium wilfordii]
MVVVGGDEGFMVSVKKKEMVAAMLPMQEHWLPLSNLDLLLPPLDVSLFLCYKKPITISTTTTTMVGILKKALAQALVSYYAFGGEVVENSVGEPELLCNNNGVEFIEAFADVKLQNLDFYNPDESVEGKLVPKKKLGVLAVQVTELKCGGLVVGCTFDHRISDAHSANMFLVSWAEIAQSKPISTLPSFRRSILNPRYPVGEYDRSLDEMYIPISTLPPPEEPSPSDHLLSRIYYIKANDLIDLQSLASSNECKRTKLESFSALLWKIVAKSATKDTIASNKVSNMGVVVDGRTRLGHDGVHKATKMETYFGNVLSIPYGSIRVNDLISKPLNWVADEIHGFLETLVTKDHFLDLIDWVEAHRPEPAMCKIYNSRNDDGPAFVVSSGQRFPVEKMDFGWGEPIFGSYHFPWGGRCGYVMPMPGPRRNGDWIVYMHLSKGQLELIETEASNVFKPLTPEYLNVVSTSS